MKVFMFKNRKGISPLIATLLLIAIAVAASVLTYSWVMSMIGSQSAQAQTQVRVDAVTWIPHGAQTAGSLYNVTIRNTGSIAAQLESISIRPNTSGSVAFSYPVSKSIPVSSALTVKVTGVSPVMTPNTSYVVRVTTNTGFYYESTVSTPASWP